MMHEVGGRAAASGMNATDVAMAREPIVVLGEVDGAAGADAALAAMDPKLLESAQRLAAVVEKATDQVLNATPQKRAADTIVKAGQYLGPGATVEQLNHVANCIASFARDAANFLERGDIHALDGAIVTFWNGVRGADRLAPPKPPLMPHGDNVFAGWSTAEESGLRNILRKGLCGVTVGDRAVAIDADGADLASGKRVSKKAALDACAPPASGKLIAVGSLPRVMAVIRALS